MRLDDKSILVTFIVVLIAVAVGKIMITQQETATNAITETGIGDGYRYFFEFKNQLEQKSATRWRRPILNKEDLKPFDTYFLISPKRPFSDHEGKVLMEWIKGGGRVVMSFKDEATLKRIESWISKNKIQKPPSGELEEFENGKTRNVLASGTSQFLGADENYTFYSYLGFRDAQCDKFPESCYIREISLGLGELVLIAGLPPFANGMVGLEDNAKFAARIALWSGRSAFDEFHQFMTEKSFGDMAGDPRICVPAIGFLLMALLYFFLGSGDIENRDRTISGRTKSVTSYHSLGRETVRRAIAAPVTGIKDGLSWHLGTITRNLPSEKHRIEELKDQHSGDPKSLAIKLIRFHQEWLKIRGKK